MVQDALASPQVCPVAGSVGSSVWHIRHLSGGTFCPNESLHRHSVLRAELRLPFLHPLRAHVGHVPLWALGFLSNWDWWGRGGFCVAPDTCQSSRKPLVEVPAGLGPFLVRGSP